MMPRTRTVEDSVLGLANSTSGLASCYRHKCARCDSECPECRHHKSCSDKPRDEPVTTKGVVEPVSFMQLLGQKRDWKTTWFCKKHHLLLDVFLKEESLVI